MPAGCRKGDGVARLELVYSVNGEAVASVTGGNVAITVPAGVLGKGLFKSADEAYCLLDASLEISGKGPVSEPAVAADPAPGELARRVGVRAHELSGLEAQQIVGELAGALPAHAVARRAGAVLALVLDKVLASSGPLLFLRGLIPWLGFQAENVPFTVERRLAGRTSYSLRRMIQLSVHGLLKTAWLGRLVDRRRRR